MTLAYRRRTCQIAFRRDDHARLALDRLYQEGHRVRRDGRFERIRIAIRDRFEAGRKWPKLLAILRLTAEADNGGRPPMKIAVADDDLRMAIGHALDLIAPFAYQFDRRLDRLRPAIHGQHLRIARQV